MVHKRTWWTEIQILSHSLTLYYILETEKDKEDMPSTQSGPLREVWPGKKILWAFCTFLCLGKKAFCVFFTSPSSYLFPFLRPFIPSVIFLVSTPVSSFSCEEIDFIFQFPWTKDWALYTDFRLSQIFVAVSKNRMFHSEAQRWSCCKRRKPGILEGTPTQASYTRHHQQHIHAETARRGCRSQRHCFQNINIVPTFVPMRNKNPDYSRRITAKLCKIEQVLSVCLTPFNC